MNFAWNICCSKNTLQPAPIEVTGSETASNPPVGHSTMPLTTSCESPAALTVSPEELVEGMAKVDEIVSKVDEIVAEEMYSEIFKISLPRDRSNEDDLCIDIDDKYEFHSLLILRVRNGPVKDWNDKNSPNFRVRHLDRIIEVNDMRGDSLRMKEVIKAERGTLNMTIKRPMEFKINLVKGFKGHAAKIGLDIVHSAMESLLIKRVKEGMINDWNSRNPMNGVRVGDRIVEINGERGDSQRLLDMVASKDALEVVICRISE
eukprot:TRINITY_DN35506_c0_g2_i1.p1 TRINITY_DN35506_c0_g2~~TRINITY_DN35506_c0_g2_i1.p1  ORF type:complete len:261 (+),score=40.39 TRINITY_DN35506_c0_g2_i1:93-875(+)